MKIETTHTPGPWIVRNTMESWAGERAGEILISADLGYVAIALPRNESDLRDNSVIGGEVGSADANARLIAAAPELLEAARAVLLAEKDDWREPTRSLAASAARDAVAKAVSQEAA